MTLWRGVRYREDVGFELRCEDCAARKAPHAIYWPLTLEFWDPPRGMGRCRACWAERRSRQRRRRPMTMAESRVRAEQNRQRDREHEAARERARRAA